MSKIKVTLEDKVFDYFVAQNRPYNVTDVVSNLHNEYKKSEIQKAIDTLVATEKLLEKENGKQKIYFVNQSHFPKVDEKELADMDEEIKKLNSVLASKKAELRNKEAKYTAFTSRLTLDQVRSQKVAVANEIEMLNQKLVNVEEMMKNTDPKELERLKKERQKYVDEWKKRKRLAMNVLDMISEYYDKDRKVLIEEIGIETDEEVGVAIPKN